MSSPKCFEADVNFFLPKRENSTITKTFGVCIEDFLEKLEAAEKISAYDDFIKLPEVSIGYNLVNVTLNNADPKGGYISVYVNTSLSPGSKEMNIIQKGIIVQSCKVEVVCGNLSFEKEDVDGNPINVDGCSVDLKPIKDLKEAMITSGNYKLDLKITLTIMEDEWIVTR